MTAAPPPIRFGILGTASIARRRTLPALAAHPGARIAAIASRDPARARELAALHRAEPVTGYRELLDRTDLDAVYVPLPIALHRTWVEQALRSGRHVLAEKPLTPNAADTAELLALAEKQRLVLFENFLFLSHPQHARVRALLDEGLIGPVRTLSADFAVPPPPPDDIRHRVDLGGGALADIGVYPLRAAQLFLGPELDVHGAALRLDPDRGVDLGGSVLLGGPGGTTAQLSFGMAHSYRSHYSLWGARGRIEVDRAFTPPPGHAPVIRVEHQDLRTEHTLPPHDQTAATVDAFVARIRAGAGNGTPAPQEGPGIAALGRLLERVRDAAARPATPCPERPPS